MKLIALAILAALPDSAVFAMWGFNIAATVAMFAWANSRRDVDALKKEVKEESDRYINERFNVMNAQSTGSMNLLTQAIDGLKARLCDGDEDLESLLESKHQLTLRIEQSVSSLKEYIHQTCATKEDVAKVEQKVEQLKSSINNRSGRGS